MMEAALHQVAKPLLTKYSYAYHRVREMILDGRLAPGSQVSQPRLARDLGISITPLREAMKQLDAEGLVRLSSFRTVVVSTLGQDEIEDLLAIRAALDPLAAQLAASQSTKVERRQLDAAGSYLAKTFQGSDRFDLCQQYFSLLYRMSGNGILMELLDPVWVKAYRYYQQSAFASEQDDTALEHIGSQLQAVTRAIVAGNPEDAQSSMMAYCRGYREPWFASVGI